MPSLREIEKTVGTIWINREARDWFLKGRPKKGAPNSIEDLSSDVLDVLDPKGAELYGRLINFGHYDLLCSIFPYCHKVLGKSWDEVAEEYFLEYPSDHYNLNRICRHFSQFFANHAELLEKYPYLAELADYEWLELERAEDPALIERADDVSIDSLERIGSYSPVVNPTLVLRKYEFPILEMASHFENAKRIKRKFEKQNCNIIMYRDPAGNRVRIMELGKVASALVLQGQAAGSTYQDLLRSALELNPQGDPQALIVQFLELVEELQADNIFVGSRRI